MEYSFDVCHRFGEVYLSDDRKGCALVLLPERKKVNLKSILLDLKLILTCFGFRNLRKVMNREAKIKKLHPHIAMYYLWYIGVLPGEQHQGTGSNLLQCVMDAAARQNRPVYLETSTVSNIPWYGKSGFTVYNKLHLGYKLYFTRNADK